MVRDVRTCIGNPAATCISKLTLDGHGSPGNMSVGDETGWVEGKNISTGHFRLSLVERQADTEGQRRSSLVRASGKVSPSASLTFVVQDTIDLCPENCGTSEEQVATIPMSRFEATGLVGDVPFILRFEAPPDKLTPFVVSS